MPIILILVCCGGALLSWLNRRRLLATSKSRVMGGFLAGTTILPSAVIVRGRVFRRGVVFIVIDRVASSRSGTAHSLLGRGEGIRGGGDRVVRGVRTVILGDGGGRDGLRAVVTSVT